jgi:hypothetical protein
MFGVLNHEPDYKEMPKVRAKLDTCGIAYVKQWIETGAELNQ